MTEKMRSFVKGLLAGLTSRAEFPQGKEPVAYLYNGVRLPKLPDTVMPYLCITGNDGVGYYLRCGSVPLYYWLNQYAVYVRSKEDGAFATYRCVTGNPDNWGENSEEEGGSYTRAAVEIVWANYDVLNYDDDTLYLAASEPVPVYE